MLKIGNVAIEKTAALAPMASVADRAYRTICKEYGACYVVGEMVSAKGLCFSPNKALELITVTDEERPMAVQLFGSEPEYFEKALPKVLNFQPDVIDINMGCPVPKVTKSNSGCMLMKNPKLAEQIARSVVKNSSVPVTVKIRKGWDDSSINAVEFAKRMQSCGISGLTIHGRTKSDMYSNKADWDIIAKVKKSLSIPVIANGDIVSPETAKDMYDATGADLIMVGRGSYGRPWLFKQISDYLKTGKYDKDPTITERIVIMKKHVDLICQDNGQQLGMKKARAHIIRYLYGIRDAAKYREKCSRLTLFSELLDLIDEILENCN